MQIEFTGSGLQEIRGILMLTTDKIALTRIGPQDDAPTVEPPPPGEKGARREWDRQQQRENQRRQAREREFANGTRAGVEVAVAADCPPGRHAFRLHTTEGLAETITFWVSRYENVSEQEVTDQRRTDTNGTIATAETVPPGRTVQGFLNGADEDTFRVEMKAGQVLSAEAEAERLGSSERDDGFEAALVVRDAAGKILAEADDTALLLTDPWLSVTAPADGPLFVTIKPLLPATDSRAVPWRMHIGRFERPGRVFPAGGPPGKMTVTLPDGRSTEITVPGAADSGVIRDVTALEAGTWGWRADPETPTANLMRVSPGVNILESEPNDTLNEAIAAGDAVAALAVNGVLERPNDVDCYRFAAKKGQKLDIRAISQGIGSPADLKMTVQPAPGVKGGKTERADDAGDGEAGVFDGGTMREKLDPVIFYDVPADGEYVVTVEDSRGAGGPEFIYRIEISEPPGGMLLGLAPVDRNSRSVRSAVTVGRGNRTFAVILTRPLPGPRPEGELVLKARGLPGGVTMHCSPFRADQGRVPVVFDATGDAAVSAAAVSLEVETAEGKPVRSFFRQTIALVSQNNEPFQSFTQESLAVAVSGRTPFRIEVAPPPGALAKNGEMELEVQVHREAGWDEPVELLIDLPPAGITGAQGLTVPPGQSTMLFRIAADGNAKPGTWPVALTARNKSGDNRTGAGKIFACSAFVPIEVADPWVRLKFARCPVERGRKATLTGTVERIRELPGPATVNLLRLPRGVTLTAPVVLAPEGDKIVLEIEAAADALVGSYNGITAEVTVETGGRKLKQTAGGASVRVDPSRAVVE